MAVVLVERGASLADCQSKIVQKYGIYFEIMMQRTIPKKFFGLIPESLEVEYVLQDSRMKMAAQSGGPGIPMRNPGEQTAAAVPKNDSTIDFIEEKKRLLAAAGKDPDQVLQQVREEENSQQLIFDKLKEIQEKIETGKKEEKPEYPAFGQISQLMKLNDFSERYAAGILERMRKELPLDVLEDFSAVQDSVLAWIGESVKIYRMPEKPKSKRIMVLIGPTGVGKTTTVAKLAAIYGIENAGRRPLSVRMITIDAFRIGAIEQIEKYCRIMELPVSCIENHRDLRREIDLYSEETDLILVDTIGRSPRDSAKLGEMKELLDACGTKAEIHLVLSASTKASDMEHILQQFEPFNYQAILLTKLDETRHIGNVVSSLAERNKPISYITDGQHVPKDIKKASVVRLLINLEDFRIDREKIEKQFPAPEADQFQWG